MKYKGSLDNLADQNTTINLDPQPNPTRFDRAITSTIGCITMVLATPLVFGSSAYMGGEFLNRSCLKIQELFGTSICYYEGNNLLGYAVAGIAGVGIYSCLGGKIIQESSNRIERLNLKNN